MRFLFTVILIPSFLLLRQVDRVGVAKKTDAVSVDDTLREAELTVDAAAIEGVTEEEVCTCLMCLSATVSVMYGFCTMPNFLCNATAVRASAMLVCSNIGLLLSCAARRRD